jgi:poly(hydroxyalkanoate) depolymerase family esterase
MSQTHRLISFASVSLIVSLASCAVAPPDSGEANETAVSRATSSISAVASFGDNPGALKMYEHVPAGLASGAPAVLVLHGCMQSATDSAQTGWNELSDELKFLVVYPEQQTGNNAMRCFNWAGEYGDPANLVRGKGENQSVKSMVDKAIELHGVDPKKIFIVGFSGGGGMAALMAATWPDRIAGAATLAGIPYNCTTQFSEVSACLKPGKDRPAEDWGNRVREGFPGYAGPWPKMAFWQGTSDNVVAPLNRTQLIRQWTNVHAVSETASATDTVDGQRRSVFNDAAGNTVIETFEIQGMSHGVPVRPNAACGTTGQYSIDKGICAARHIAKFFGLTAAN